MLSIQWDKTNKVTITVNGLESKAVELSQGFSDVSVGILKGGIDIKKLAYRDASRAPN